MQVDDQHDTRDSDPRPTRGPYGAVKWWERPTPDDGDPGLWRAVQRLQARRMQLGLSVTELARRMDAAGRPMTRETLSRVLNGKQPTTWSTAEHLALMLGIRFDEPDRG